MALRPQKCGQRPVDGKFHCGVHQRVDDFKHLHAQHRESDSMPHAAAIPFIRPVHQRNAAAPADTGAQRHPKSRLIRADDPINSLTWQSKLPGRNTRVPPFGLPMLDPEVASMIVPRCSAVLTGS